MQVFCTFEDFEFLKKHKNILIRTLKHLELEFQSENFESFKEEINLLKKEFNSVQRLIKRFVKNYKKSNFKFDNDFSKLINLALNNQNMLSEKIYIFIEKHKHGKVLRKYFNKSTTHTMAYFKIEERKGNLIL